MGAPRSVRASILAGSAPANAMQLSRAPLPAFYIYEDLLTFWDTACANGVDALLDHKNLTKSKAVFKVHPAMIQHAGEVLLPRALASNTQRVYDPQRAEYFIVPAYLGLNLFFCGGTNATGANIIYLRDYLKNSPWFKRNDGLDHMIVSSHFSALSKVYNKGKREQPLLPLLKKVCWAVQVASSLFYSKAYSAMNSMVPVPLSEQPPPAAMLPWHSRPAKVFFGGQTHNAGIAYVARRALIKFAWTVKNIVYTTSECNPVGASWAGNSCRHTNDVLKENKLVATNHSRAPLAWETNIKHPVRCLPFPSQNCSGYYLRPCPNRDLSMSDGCWAHHHQREGHLTMKRMAKAQYNLAWPGDHGLWSVSSRIYDGIAAGTVPVFLSHSIPHQTIAFHRHLPWDEMSIAIEHSTFTANRNQAIEDAIKRAEADGPWMARALALLDKHAPDVLWRHPESRVSENIVRSCAANRRAYKNGSVNRMYTYQQNEPKETPVLDLWD